VKLNLITLQNYNPTSNLKNLKQCFKRFPLPLLVQLYSLPKPVTLQFGHVEVVLVLLGPIDSVQWVIWTLLFSHREMTTLKGFSRRFPPPLPQPAAAHFTCLPEILPLETTGQANKHHQQEKNNKWQQDPSYVLNRAQLDFTYSKKI